jgi:hypothetical protein
MGERVLLGPTRGRLGPLRGAAQVAQLLARADQAAVDFAGRVRPEPVLDREQHRLVEVGDPGARPPAVDEDPAERLQRLRLEIGGAELARQRASPLGVSRRLVEPAAAVRLLGLPQQ